MRKLVALSTVMLFGVLGCEERKSMIVQPKVDEQFFAYLDNLSGDEMQRMEHSQIIEKLAIIIGNEVKKDPRAMSMYIEDMIKLIPQAGIGSALQAEVYASETLREELNHLRQDSNVEKLIEQDKKILALEKRIHYLEARVSILQKEDKKSKEVAKEEKKDEFGMGTEGNRRDIEKMLEKLQHGRNLIYEERVILQEFGRNLEELWNYCREWPEKTIVSKTCKIYIIDGGTNSSFHLLKQDGYPIEYELPFGFQFVGKVNEGHQFFWDNMKPIQYCEKIIISMAGKPIKFFPAAQLTDDGMDYIKGWILANDIER